MGMGGPWAAACLARQHEYAPAGVSETLFFLG